MPLGAVNLQKARQAERAPRPKEGALGQTQVALVRLVAFDDATPRPLPRVALLGVGPAEQLERLELPQERSHILVDLRARDIGEPIRQLGHDRRLVAGSVEGVPHQGPDRAQGDELGAVTIDDDRPPLHDVVLALFCSPEPGHGTAE
jgi:hypothetical protein